MATTLTCDICGGTLEGKGNNLYKCKNCRTEKVIHNWGGEIDIMLDKALCLRLEHAYDLAYDIYLDIVDRNPECIDAYWGALLSKYGVEISQRTGYKPSLHKISESVFTQEDLFRKILSSKYVDGIASVEFKKRADEIELVRCEAIKEVRTQPKYDIFLSFKNKTTEDGDSTFTPDHYVAERIYESLTKKGYKVFFAPVTLKGKAGLIYEPIIYAALHSADSMILIASKQEYINSPWVANEWKRFREILTQSKRNQSTRNMRLFICHYGELKVANLPEDLSRYQTVNLGTKAREKEFLEAFPKCVQRKASSRAKSKNKITINPKRVKRIALAIMCFVLIAAFGTVGYWMFKPIPVESVIITSKTTVGINEEVLLLAKITPTKTRILASKQRGVSFRILGDNHIGAVIVDNTFSAQQEGSVDIVAMSGGVESESVKINVVFVDVEAITITASPSFKVTESLELSVSLIPANATKKTVEYQIVNEGTTAEGATISNSKLTATGIGIINIKAVSTYNNTIESSILSVEVLKEPVTYVRNTNANNGYYARETATETFNSADSFSNSGWVAVGSAATYQNEAGLSGSFSLRIAGSATAYFYKPLTLNSNESLSLDFYTYAASNIDNFFVKLSNDTGLTWINAHETGALTNKGWQKQSITIQGSLIEGSNRNIWLAFFSVPRNPTNSVYIDDISYSINTPAPSFARNSSLTLISEVAPNNATFKEVTYEIVTSKTTATGVSVDGNILTATGMGIICLRPKADGIFGEEFFVSVT